MQKQSQSHPDVGVATSNQDDSALLNAAYKTLMDPLKRAEHFLQVKNVNVEETLPEVMMQAFELQENYSALTSLEDKKIFQKKLKNQMEAMLESLRETEENLQEFCKIFSRLRFIGSFLEKVCDDVHDRN